MMLLYYQTNKETYFVMSFVRVKHQPVLIVSLRKWNIDEKRPIDARYIVSQEHENVFHQYWICKMMVCRTL